MSEVVGTGQVTFVDQNDATPLTAFITANQGLSQTKSVSDAEVTSYLPDYTSSNNTLTAKVYCGASDVTANLTNRKWSLNDPAGSSIGSEVTYVLATNQDPDAAAQRTYIFQGDYTDPVTLIVTHVMTQITLTSLRTGTNAIFILVRGINFIEKSESSTLAVAKVWADVLRGSTVDDTGSSGTMKYKWFKYPYAGADQLDANHADVTGSKVKFVATANINQGNWSSYASAPADGTWADVKGLEVREDAVVDIGLYKVQASSDGSTVLAEAYFQIYDIGDPYDIGCTSDSGFIFQNGSGTKTLTPTVRHGAGLVTPDSSWSWAWALTARDGKKSGFVDTTRTSGGRTISSHTTGGTAAFTIGVAVVGSTVAGDVIRVINAARTIVRCYEISTAGSNPTVLTIRAPQNGFDSTSVTTNEFVGGTLWLLQGTGATAGNKSTTGANTITISGDDVDGTAALLISATH
jgi:hypothetical protein